MRISYDWRLSRLINDEGVVIDEIYWTSDVTVSNLVRRLLLLQKGRMSPEARILYERFDDVEVFSEGHLNDINWPPYGENEQKMFDEAIIKMTKFKIAESSGDVDKRLDMLVS